MILFNRYLCIRYYVNIMMYCSSWVGLFVVENLRVKQCQNIMMFIMLPMSSRPPWFFPYKNGMQAEVPDSRPIRCIYRELFIFWKFVKI